MAEYEKSDDILNEPILESKKKGISLFGTKRIDLGCCEVACSDVPFPCFDPLYFDKVKKSENPCIIRHGFFDWIFSSLLAVYNLALVIFSVVIFVAYQIQFEQVGFIILSVIAASIICLVMCPLQFFIRYILSYYSAGNSKWAKWILVIFIVFTLTSTIFYVYALFGVVGTTGVVQYFQLMNDVNNVPVLVFFVMNALGMVGWTVLVCVNLTLFCVFGCKLLKKVRRGFDVSGDDIPKRERKVRPIL